MTELHVGVTGSRDGASDQQTNELRDALEFFVRFHPAQLVLHHGDCTGVDALAARLAQDLGYRVVCHPPTATTYRAFTKADETLPAKEYLSRDRDIVNASSFILAVPSKPRAAGGGTWYTVGYAEGLHKPVLLLS